MMKHLVFLALAAFAIFYVSGSVANAIDPTDQRLWDWIQFHGLYYSPTFLIGYAFIFVVLLPAQSAWMRASLAFLAGLILWGAFYAFDLHDRVIPVVEAEEEKRKERIAAIQKGDSKQVMPRD